MAGQVSPNNNQGTDNADSTHNKNHVDANADDCENQDGYDDAEAMEESGMAQVLSSKTHSNRFECIESRAVLLYQDAAGTIR